MGVAEMLEGAGCVVWIPAFAGMTEGVGRVFPSPSKGERLGWV